MLSSPSTRTAYVVAVFGVLLALMVRALAGRWLGPDVALALLAIPVLAAAWLGGLRPGIIATMLGGLSAVYFLVRPWDASHLAEVGNQLRVILFTLLGVAASYLGEIFQVRRRGQQAELEAQSLRRQWDVILGGIPTPFYTLDDNWRFVFVSDRLLDVTGLSRDRFLGRTAWEVLGHSAGMLYEEKLREASAQQDVVTFDYHDGASDRWLENHVYPFSNGVAVLVADITHRKQAEAALRVSEERFRTMATNAPVAIFIKDLSGKYTLANPLACEALGHRESVTGLTDYDLMSTELADEIRRHDLEVISSGEAIEREEVIAGPNGEQLFLSVKFPLRNTLGEAEGVCGVALNVTARRSAEEAQALLAAIVASSDEAIVSKSIDGTILSWNARAERLFGYSATEAIGNSINLIVPQDRLDEEQEVLDRLRRGERIDLFETVRISKRGRLIDVSMTASLLRDGTGRVVGASIIMRNITERKQAEEMLRQSEEQFHLLSDSIPQLAWMARTDGHIFWYNKRWYEYTGATPQQMLESGWQDRVDPRERPRVVEKWKAALASEQPWEDTFPIRRHDGALRWHLSRALPLKDESGRVVRWFGTNTDVTEQRQMEETLRNADRRKDEFLATLAHELRNPLAPIRSSLQILRLAGTSDPTLRQVEEVMGRQVEHLVRLVDDLLDVSRITRGKIELRKEPIDVALIVRNAVEVSRPTIDANHHDLTVSLPPEPLIIYADTVRMAQVLSNLLNNAAKFTPEGGRIELSARQENDQVLFSVRDSGPGMAAELLPHVFELFTQGEHSPGRTSGGLGIGLTLVKSLAELHGGSVAAFSDGLGQGSEFIVRLPLLAPGAAPTPMRMAAPPYTSTSHAQRAARQMLSGNGIGSASLEAIAKRRFPSPILVVDDLEDAASALAILLRAYGAQVHLAHCGASALSAIAEHHPSVVLLDIGMPGMDGYEVARQIREQPQYDDVTLIALTGWGQDDDRRRTREVGFNYHLLKPIDIGALEDVLTSLSVC